MLDPGRSLERMSDCTPRGMIVLDRTRLIGINLLYSGKLLEYLRMPARHKS
jgi:hypothetical protein